MGLGVHDGNSPPVLVAWAEEHWPDVAEDSALRNQAEAASPTRSAGPRNARSEIEIRTLPGARGIPLDFAKGFQLRLSGAPRYDELYVCVSV